MSKVFSILLLTTSAMLRVSAATYYVDASRPNDDGVATNWVTAKKTIQAAVNLTCVGDTVLVTNGIYNTGTATPLGYALKNRVVITNAITVRSVNGPEATVIEGSGTIHYDSESAVRCVYMKSGALEGFTLQDGATYGRVLGDSIDCERYGGGVNMYDSVVGTAVSNCIMRNCFAFNGGGSCYGTLNNCTLSGNAIAWVGGGAFGGVLNNCTLSGNKSVSNNGGGAYMSTLNNCTLSGNTASCGGGAIFSTLNNCTLSGNTATYGGGSYDCSLNNCILWRNVAYGNDLTSNHTGFCRLSYSCSTPLPKGPGNIDSDPMLINIHDLRLRSVSPCLDKGTNACATLATDLAGNPRIQNGRVDMGAYEGCVPCVVVFDAQGGTVSLENRAVVYGALYGELPDPVRQGYVFLGWWTGAAGTGSHVTENCTVESDTEHTLYAKWAVDPFVVAPVTAAVPIGDTNAVQYADIDSGFHGLSIRLGGVGLLADGGMAGIEWRLKGPGTLEFDWKVSSESEHDVLRFYEVGSGPTNEISGTVAGWVRHFVAVNGEADAVHTFRLEYGKDAVGGSAGQDCGWVDAISWEPHYVLTVNHGAGGGFYTNGSVVAITADAPPAYHVFDRWTGLTDGVADVFVPSTTLVMPSTGVVVTATYMSLLHRLTVVNGSGSGDCLEGQTVSVTANPDPLYKAFAGWSGDDTGLLSNAAARATSLVMPSRPVSLTATYSYTIERVAGCYGRKIKVSGQEGGVSVDDAAGSPSCTPAVKLGGICAVSGTDIAAVETVITGSGTIAFLWKVVSHDNDYGLIFKVDGTQVTSISDTAGSWEQYACRIEGSGASHILRWEYVRIGPWASSTDAGWLDDIVWTGDVPDPVITPDICAAAATNNAFSFRFLGERGIPYTVYSNSTLSTSGWAPMAVVPRMVSETNGVFLFESIVFPPAAGRSGFYRVIGNDSP